MVHKRGQNAGNAAAFVAILAVLIILYILFLPPDIRTELLGDPNGIINDSTGSNSNTKVLLQQNVGRVTYINTNEKTYDLPATRIYSPTSGQVLKNIPSISLRNALFDTEKSTYTTELVIDRDTTKNVLLSFNVREGVGPLSITLNGAEIFSSQDTVSNPTPIPLGHEDLLDSNTITLSTSSPGWTFWRANKYSIYNFQISGDVTDYSNALATQHFVISQVEKENLESVKLYFYPSCDLTEVGSLKISFNGNTIYNSMADCGTRTFATLNIEQVVSGSNELKFYSNAGTYTLDNMYIKTSMKKPAYRTYYFDIAEEYFYTADTEARCGDYDNECPSGCDESEDADCCFIRNGYWCALPTLNYNDRCRYYVSADDCMICKTGYYDESGDAPDTCEETCGDNNDDECPSSCPQPNRYYDKDCCFAQDPDNYWCEETPITGIEDKCQPSVSPGECDLCPSGYLDEDGRRPESCSSNGGTSFDDGEYKLSEDYELKIIVRFVDNTERKRVDFDVNGHTFRIDTTNIEYSKIISSFAEMNTNSVQIVPVNDDVDIADVRVELRRIR